MRVGRAMAWSATVAAIGVAPAVLMTLVCAGGSMAQGTSTGGGAGLRAQQSYNRCVVSGGAECYTAGWPLAADSFH